MSDAVQKRCRSELRVLPLLDKQLFQLVVDARAPSLSPLNVPVSSCGWKGTPGNLALRKGMDGMDIRNINHAGLLGDVDAGVTHDAISHDILLTTSRV